MLIGDSGEQTRAGLRFVVQAAGGAVCADGYSAAAGTQPRRRKWFPFVPPLTGDADPKPIQPPRTLQGGPSKRRAPAAVFGSCSPSSAATRYSLASGEIAAPA